MDGMAKAFNADPHIVALDDLCQARWAVPELHPIAVRYKASCSS
ncbi:MAG: hypothetical protein ACE5LB_00615 [Acidiferrobacterales bacterium]